MKENVDKIKDILPRISNRDYSHLVKGLDKGLGKVINFVEELNRKMDLKKSKHMV